MNIKPIETHYAGCRFRSRLEARWAVFFTTLGIRWEYEPQGYELPSGRRYLPDFLLPEMGMWVEVKGDEASFLAEGARYAEATHALGGTGILVLGPVPDVRAGEPQHFVLTSQQHSSLGYPVLCLDIALADMLTKPDAVREHGLLCTDLVSHQPDALPALDGYRGGRAKYTDCGPMPAGWEPSKRVAAAYRAARSARFEHGEVPA